MSDQPSKNWKEALDAYHAQFVPSDPIPTVPAEPDEWWRYAKDPQRQQPIRRRYEDAGIEIVEAIRRDYVKDLDENDGGQILVWILDLVAIAVLTDSRKLRARAETAEQALKEAHEDPSGTARTVEPDRIESLDYSSINSSG